MTNQSTNSISKVQHCNNSHEENYVISLILSGIIGLCAFAVMTEPTYSQMYDNGVDKSYRIYVDSNHQNFIGTGFVVQGESGHKFMMTAGHICDAAEANKVSLYTDISEKSVVFPKWASLNSHDICILGHVDEDLPAYRVGSEPEITDKLWAIGFPVAYPLTVMSGNVIGDVNVTIQTDHSINDCQGIYKKIMRTMFGTPVGEICAIQGVETAVTMSVAPGASGSPVINRYGELVGIVSAQNERTAQWLTMVPHRFLKTVIDEL